MSWFNKYSLRKRLIQNTKKYKNQKIDRIAQEKQKAMEKYFEFEPILLEYLESEIVSQIKQGFAEPLWINDRFEVDDIEYTLVDNIPFNYGKEILDIIKDKIKQKHGLSLHYDLHPINPHSNAIKIYA